MFIQNNIGEVVNVDHIIAVKVFDDEQPYQIHVFTEKSETIFEFECECDVKDSAKRLGKLLAQAHLRWAVCQNWMFRADKIMAINDEACRNLTVSMVGKTFHVYLNAKNDDDLLMAKEQIEASLSEDFFNTGAVMLEKII